LRKHASTHLNAADDALDAAKQSVRNRLVVA